jgi:cyclic pyranopterin phosphate synthase
MGEMTKPEIREAFREVVHNRVPYYGEYMIKDDDGEWVINEEYIGPRPTAEPDRSAAESD